MLETSPRPNSFMSRASRMNGLDQLLKGRALALAEAKASVKRWHRRWQRLCPYRKSNPEWNHLRTLTDLKRTVSLLVHPEFYHLSQKNSF